MNFEDRLISILAYFILAGGATRCLFNLESIPTKMADARVVRARARSHSRFQPWLLSLLVLLGVRWRCSRLHRIIFSDAATNRHRPGQFRPPGNHRRTGVYELGHSGRSPLVVARQRLQRRSELLEIQPGGAVCSHDGPAWNPRPGLLCLWVSHACVDSVLKLARSRAPDAPCARST